MQEEQVYKKIHLKDIILFENDDFIVLNKPSGVLSIPDRFNHEIPSLKKSLDDRFGKIFTVHRLDRDTSGVILFAKNEVAHKNFSQAFERHEVEKIYVGIVHGRLTNKAGTINEPIAEHPAKNGKMIVHQKGKPSITHYKLIDEFGSFSFVEFKIETGRTHQIRVHMHNIGNPIVCDDLYGNAAGILLSSIKRKFKLSKQEETESPIFSRLGLHAFQLRFKDMNGKEFLIEATLPKDMKAFLQQLKKTGE